MSFGTELQSKQSHEALLSLQDCEIKLLEHMKKSIVQRIKIDRDYSYALASLASNIAKYDTCEFDTHVSQVWKTIGKETETLSYLIKDAADKVCVNSLDKLQQLISEKRVLRRIYQEERNRLDNECNKMSEGINRLVHEYTKCLEKLQRTRWKYDEGAMKGKFNPRQDEMKSKLMKHEVQANLLHNDYVVTLREAEIQDKQSITTLLPTLIQSQQNLQTSIVKQCRDILTEYVTLSDMTSGPFQQVHRNMLTHISTIDSTHEYDEFISKYKSDSLKLKNFDFTVATHLPQHEIVVDETSQPPLIQKKSEYSGSLAKCQHWLTCKTAELTEVKRKRELNDLENSNILSYLVQCRMMETLNREIIEQQCLEDRCSKMINFLSESLIKKRGNQFVSSRPQAEGLDLANLPRSNNSTLYVDHIKTAFSGIKASVLRMNPIKKQTDFERSQIFKLNFSSRGSDKSGGDDDIANNNHKSRPHLSSSRPNNADTDSLEICEIKEDFSKSDVACHLETEDWYHGILPREEVQKLLLEEGDFLVRVSKNKRTNETQHVLSVLWNENHKHFIVQETEQGEYKFEATAFKTIQDLIWHQFNSSLPITKKSEAVLKRPVPRETWELRNDDIELKEKIGSGQFGEVYRGIFKTTGQEVGVKTCRETMTEAEKLKFLQEGRILKQYDHPNVVKFIGIAVHRHPVMIIMEFVPGGSLMTFLRERGAHEQVTSLIKMCQDVASGMAYLESKNCLHRDLAARNCLVGKHNIVKISDFGMSREEREYIISGGLKQIPVKWTAPEALNYGTYTWACDVWSFGILVWEIFSEGGTPYPGMANNEAKTQVDAGFRMPRPCRCPVELYQLVLSCWKQVPRERPHFGEIFQHLVDLGKSFQ